MGVPPSDRFLQALRAVAARPPARAATGAGITAAGTCRRSCTPGSSTGPRARPSGLEGDGETGDSPRSPAAGSAVGGSRLGRGLRVTIAVALVLGRRRALAGSAVIGAGCLGHRRAHLARGSSVRRQPGPARHRHGRRPGRGHPPEHRRGQPPRPYQRPGPGRGSRGRRRGPGRVPSGRIVPATPSSASSTSPAWCCPRERSPRSSTPSRTTGWPTARTRRSSRTSSEASSA